MATGTVKWFNDDKGFGFITPDEPGKDLFVHHTGIAGDGFKSLAEGAQVQYDAEPSDKGPKAVTVRRLSRRLGERPPGVGAPRRCSLSIDTPRAPHPKIRVRCGVFPRCARACGSGRCRHGIHVRAHGHSAGPNARGLAACASPPGTVDAACRPSLVSVPPPLLPSRRVVLRTLIHLAVERHPQRVLHLLREVAEQPRRARQQREAA
jgi:CspA family cold shock protein